MRGKRNGKGPAGGVMLRRVLFGMAAVAGALALLVPAKAGAAPEGLRYGFFPSRGEPGLLVILVETPDRPHVLPPETMRAIVFGHDQQNPSLSGYYEEVSYGALKVRGEVTPWLKLDKTMAQYAAASYGINYRSWPNNMGGFAADAVRAAQKAGVDFKPYDNDGDGHVDGLMIIHSGPDGAVLKNKALLWARVDYVSSFGGEPVAAGPVVVDRFSVCPEYLTPGRPDAMRTLAHEFGHLMGLPDLYDPDHSSFGIGTNGIMGILVHPKAMALPPAPCAFSRALLGWTDPAVAAGETTVSLRPAALFPDLVRVNTPVPGEYFLLEYRAPVGADASLEGNGVLIWHADDRAVYNNLYECMGLCALKPRLALVQADGRNDLEHKLKMSDPADFFPGPGGGHAVVGADTGAGGNPFAGATTLSFSGMPTGVRVSDIRIADGRATARIATDDPAVPVREYPWAALSGWQWKELKGNGDGLAGPGERMRLEFTLTNLGRKAGAVTLTASSPLVKWSGKARLGGLKPGESRRADLTLTVPKAPSSRAGGVVRSAFTDSRPPLKKPAASPAPEPGDTAMTPLPLSARFEASWFEPVVTVRTKHPETTRTVKPRLVMGVPPVLVVNDAPHELGPYVELALRPLKIPYLVIDVASDGLPEEGLAAAPPLVLWLGGVRELSTDWPDRARLKLIEAVPAAGHVLVLSAARLRGEPPPALLDLFGLEGITPGAGIGLADSGADGAPFKHLFFRQHYPYYPDLNPHLILAPSGQSSVLFTDFAGRSTVTARGPNPLMRAPGRTASPAGSAVLLGFPLEALQPAAISGLVTAILNHLAP